MPSQLPVSRGRIAAILAALAMFGPFAIDTMFPAFPAMAVSLGVSELAIQQTLSIYLVAYAATALLHGPWSDAWGRRRVILIGTAVFTAASVGCALAPTLEWLLFFRVVQGLSAGVGLIVGRAIVRDLYDGPDAQRLMSTVMMIFGIAPAIAPVIGGWIYAYTDWHAIFWFLTAFAAAIWLACLLWLPETHPGNRRVPVQPRPMMRGYGQMLADKSFRRLALSGGFNFAALFLFIASAPTYVMTHLGLGETEFGWFFGITIVGMMVGSAMSVRLAGRISPERMVGMGYVTMLMAGVASVAYSVSGLPYVVPWPILPISLLALGIAISFPAITLMLLDRYPERRGAASSLQAFISLILNAIVAGALAPLLKDSTDWLTLGALTLTVTGYLFWQLRPRQRDEPMPLPEDPLPSPNEGL